MNNSDGSPDVPYLGQTVLYRGKAEMDRTFAAIVVAVSPEVAGPDQDVPDQPDKWAVNLLRLHQYSSEFNVVLKNVHRAGLGWKSYEHEPGTWAPLPYGQWDQ